jgi:hypothetical protein
MCGLREDMALIEEMQQMFQDVGGTNVMHGEFAERPSEDHHQDQLVSNSVNSTTPRSDLSKQLPGSEAHKLPREALAHKPAEARHGLSPRRAGAEKVRGEESTPEKPAGAKKHPLRKSTKAHTCPAESNEEAAQKLLGTEDRSPSRQGLPRVDTVAGQAEMPFGSVTSAPLGRRAPMRSPAGEAPPVRDASVQSNRRVSVQIRHDVIGETPLNTMRAGGRRVTLSLHEETMEDIRSTLQSSMQRQGRGDFAELHSLPPEMHTLPPLLTSSEEPRVPEVPHTGAAQGSDALGCSGRRSDELMTQRKSISTELMNLQQALRDIIPTRAEPVKSRSSGSSAETGCSARSASSASSCQSLSPKNSRRNQPNSSKGSSTRPSGLVDQLHLSKDTDASESHTVSGRAAKVCQDIGSTSLLEELTRLEKMPQRNARS